jgi:hypothetical protein
MKKNNLKHEWELETLKPVQVVRGKRVQRYVCKVCRKILKSVPKTISVKASMWDEQCDKKVPKRPIRKPKFTPVED